MAGPVVIMTPKFYILFWLSLMGTCLLVGGVLIWKLTVLINLLTELLSRKP